MRESLSASNPATRHSRVRETRSSSMSRSAQLLLIAPLFLAQSAYAEALNISVLREEGAESCPDAVRIRATVMQHLSRATNVEEGAIEIRMASATDGTFEATVRLRSASGRSLGVRQFAESTCERLSKVVALSIALHLDPDAVAAQPAVPKKASSLPRPQAREAKTSARSMALSLGPIASFGLLPEAAIGARLGADFAIIKPLNLRTGALLLTENRTQDDRFLFGLTAFDAGLCLTIIGGDRGSLRGCASALVGEIHAVVLTLQPTEAGGRLWIGANAEVSGNVRIVGPLGIEGTIGTTVPILRHPFLIRGDATPVFQQSSAAPFVRAAMTWSF